jgi:hypothetical protein
VRREFFFFGVNTCAPPARLAHPELIGLAMNSDPQALGAAREHAEHWRVTESAKRQLEYSVEFRVW